MQNKRAKMAFDALKDMWHEMREIKIKSLRQLAYMTTDK